MRFWQRDGFRRLFEWTAERWQEVEITALLNMEQTKSQSEMLHYIWSLTKSCYMAQAVLWEQEGEALRLQKLDLAQMLRDFQITLYSSSIQIRMAERAIYASRNANPKLKKALNLADQSATKALTELRSLRQSEQGAKRLVDALEQLSAMVSD